jgi:hypothetical protein
MIVVIRTNKNLHSNTAAGATADAFKTTGEQFRAPGEKQRAAWLSS